MNIGCDIEDISRFKNKTPDSDLKFLNRIYTKAELDYCYKNKNFAGHLCARFCAKEAVVKALSGLYDKVVPYNKIEILNKENGAPYINILVDELKNRQFLISLSHDKDKAMAFVIVI